MMWKPSANECLNACSGRVNSRGANCHGARTVRCGDDARDEAEKTHTETRIDRDLEAGRSFRLATAACFVATGLNRPELRLSVVYS
jgi:hypothetical protein